MSDRGAQAPEPMRVGLVSSDETAPEWLESTMRALGYVELHHLRTPVQALRATVVDGGVDCVLIDESTAPDEARVLVELLTLVGPSVPHVLLHHEGTPDSGGWVQATAIATISDEHGEASDTALARVLDGIRSIHGGSVEPNIGRIRYTGFLEAVPDAVVVIEDGAIVGANERTADLLGYDAPAEVVDRAVSTVFEEWTSIEPERSGDGVGQVFFDEQCSVRRRDGTTVPASTSGATIERGDGATTVLACRQRSKTAPIVEGRTLKDRAIDATPIGVTIAGPTTESGDNPLIYCNEAFEEITGYDRSAVLGADCRILQGEDTDPATVAELRSAIDDEKPVTVEIRNYRRDSTPFWNRVTITPIEADGTIYYAGFQEDVTEAVERRQNLRRFRRATEAAGQAFFITDTDGTITHVNPAFEEITGYSRSETIGETPHILHSGTQDEAYYERLWETILAGEGWEADIVDERADGNIYYAHQTISPLVDEAGEVQEFVALQTDITERREREQHLKALDRVLRHNLRNELNLIEGRASHIAEGDTTDAAADARNILGTTDRLLGTVEKGRNVSELLAKRAVSREYDVRDVLERVVETVRTAHPSATVSIDNAGIGSVYAVDELPEGIEELLENAIVHDDGDSPTVSVDVAVESDTIELSIRDTGPGIPLTERQLLNDPDQDEGALFHAEGMGLWYVYWIVERSGGTLEFDERPVGGTRVTVTLPRVPDEAPPE